MKWEPALLIACFVILLSGCSGGGNPVDAPVDSQSPSLQTSAPAQDPHRVFWGLWDVTISPDLSDVEIIPDRTGAMHLNTVRLLEVEPCTTCLSIANLSFLPDNEIQCEFRLRHPAPGYLGMTGFDVRGIFISGGDHYFPVSELSASLDETKARLLFPDGYTELFNPNLFPSTDPPALGYIAGKYANGGDLSATLNPYMAYRKNEPRRMFEPGIVASRVVKLRMTDGPLEFGYAVDACWQLVEDVTNPLTDFPPDANCLEVYKMEAEIGLGLNPDNGGRADMIVQVWDHQGIDTIAEITAECPGLFSGSIALIQSTVIDDESCLYTATLVNETGVTDGEYPLLITAVDIDPDQNFGQINAYHIINANVGPPRGWAKTWGAEDWDEGYDVKVDSQGNILITGTFGESVDFDPNETEYIRATHGNYDVFLSKFTPAGELLWAKVWGGTNSDTGFGISIDDNDDIYITGNFRKKCDFDPGSDTDYHESVSSSSDIFLSKLTSDGDFLWARTWGGEERDYGYDVAANSNGDVYVTGCFKGTIDIDPGPAVDERTAPGPLDTYDSFLSKFDADGNFQWAYTFGDWWDDVGDGIEVDEEGNVYSGGYFSGLVDFDPGDGVDEHETPSGSFASYLCKFNPDGTFVWARDWGGGKTWVADVSIDLFDGVYVAGYYTAGFNTDAYFRKFNTAGEFQWEQEWGCGALGFDASMSSDSDGMGNVYVAGYFSQEVDFDTGSGEKIMQSKGLRDCFLVKFTPSGSYVWAMAFGSVLDDYAFGVGVAQNHYVYVTGRFEQTVDFDPGMGDDFHTSNGWFDAYLVKFSPDGYW